MYEQFALGNPSEVLVTSADSRIRILDGSDITHKFKSISIYNHFKTFLMVNHNGVVSLITGFRNTSSQIAASFSAYGRYIISASEDSHVYI